MKVTVVAGARPNFMKISPIIKALNAQRSAGREISCRLVHTGQHFDQKMSGDFFRQLGIPEPDANLGCGGGTQAEQTAAVMIAFERELIENRPDVVVVVGDVNSTMACTIAAKKLCVPVAHVEAGIRSGDMTMPEEINRIVTDSICDHFFTTSRLAGEILRSSNVGPERIHFVGNTMIDTLLQNLSRLEPPTGWEEYGFGEKEFYLLTLHRPANVDDPANLVRLLSSVLEGAAAHPVIFPIHPRTRKNLELTGFSHDRLLTVEPMGYLQFIYLLRSARAVITDSGGVTEEATVLNIPCMTLRDSTERPETVDVGTNELVGTDPSALPEYFEKLAAGRWKTGSIPELWDGSTSERIVEILWQNYGVRSEPAGPASRLAEELARA